MSMELYILTDKRLISIADRQRAIDDDGFSLRLSSDIPLADVRGALPVVIRGTPAAFECAPCSVDDLMEESPGISRDHHWAHALALRWGGDIDASVAAYAAAASYARATGGVIFDCEEGNIITPQRAREISAEIDGGRAEIEAALQMIRERFGG